MAAAVSVFAGCSNMPTIDKEYNALRIVPGESSLVGEFRQGDEVTDAKIVLAYSNGLGRRAVVFVPESNGIHADPFEVLLAWRDAESNGDGTIEIPLKGVPASSSKTTLRPTIRLATHEVFITFDVTPAADLVLNAAASQVEGTFKIFQPLGQDAMIRVNYNSTEPFDVSVAVAEVVGVSGPEFETTLPAAPDGGFFDVPLRGTPANHGSHNFVVRAVKGDVEYTMTKTIVIEGEITFDLDATTVTGDFVAGTPLSGAFITLAYTADRTMDVTISVDRVDGVYADAFTETLAAGSGTVDIPLSGAPTNDNDKKLVITLIDENNIAYTAEKTIVMNPGVDFVEETVTFNSLTYKTVFVDVNGNGKATTGEVWLDRNIGATSADPGTYGAAGANAASFGQFLQWGKAYGETAYDGTYVIDFDATSPWTTVCPPGYEVPSLEQWVKAFEKLTGGTRSGNTVTGVAGITLVLMDSALRLPMSGWFANGGAQENRGTMGTYWTSTKGSNTAPWRVQLNNDAATATGGGWADRAWQVPVRCIKTL